MRAGRVMAFFRLMGNSVPHVYFFDSRHKNRHAQLALINLLCHGQFADDRRISDHSHHLLSMSGSYNLQRVDRHAPKYDLRKSFGAAYLLPRRLRSERRQREDRRVAA